MEAINKVLYNLDQTAETTEAEKATARTNIGAQAQLTAGSNVSITNNVISATDTTYGVFSTSADGLVPKASGTGDTGKFLKGDGTWEAISTTVNATAPLYGSGTQADPLLLRVSHGLSVVQPVGDYTYLQVTHPVPAPGSTSANKVLTCTDTLGNLAWQTPAPVPTVNDGILTIQKNGTQIGSFSANQSAGSTINMEVPVLSTFETTGDEDIITNLNGLCVDKTYGQLLDGISGNVLALLPRPTGSADYGKYLYRNGNTIAYRDLPDLDVDYLRADGIEYYNLQSGDNYISLPWSDSRATIIQMQSDASADIYLETDSAETVHSMLVLANAGQGGVYYCAHVVVHYNDELGNARTWDIPFGTTSQGVIIDAYLKKVGSGMSATSIGRVTVRKQDEAVQF